MRHTDAVACRGLGPDGREPRALALATLASRPSHRAPSCRMRPLSLLQLGWYFGRRLLARLGPGPSGLSRFETQYEPDGLYPLDREEQAVTRALSRCIACGICDARFSAYGDVDRTALRAPSDLVIAHARSLPDWDALVPALCQLARGDLEDLEAACPVQVPFARVVEVTRARAVSLRARREARAIAPQTADRRHDPG